MAAPPHTPHDALSKRRARVRRSRGVTLFEVLIVVALIALISSAVSVAALTYWEHAKRHDADSAVHTIRAAVKLWWLERDAATCPQFSDLVHDGTLDQGSPARDPWGSPWVIECVGPEITVSSNGADRQPGTPDDIRAPPPDVASREIGRIFLRKHRNPLRTRMASKDESGHRSPEVGFGGLEETGALLVMSDLGQRRPARLVTAAAPPRLRRRVEIDA